jgi:hypothetical protein
MREVAIWGIKGGQGKTCLAVHLAVAATKKNPDRRVAIVDLDQQGTATKYGQGDEFIERGIPVYPGELPADKRNNYDLVIYDYPSAVAYPPSQRVAILCTEAPTDQLDTWKQSRDIVAAAGVPYQTVLMNYDRHIPEHKAVHGPMVASGALVMARARIYERAGAYYQTIFHEDWSTSKVASQRRREILKILKSVELMLDGLEVAA